MDLRALQVFWGHKELWYVDKGCQNFKFLRNDVLMHTLRNSCCYLQLR